MVDWKSIVGTVAPVLATALGGPLAGVAVKALSSKLLGKTDGTEDEVGAAVAAMSPADLVKLKEVEADLTKSLAAVDVDLERIAAADRDSARRRAVDQRDLTPNLLAFAILSVYSVVLWQMLGGQKIEGDAQVIFMMFGALTTALGQALNYFFGTTRSSAAKDKTLAGLVQK